MNKENIDLRTNVIRKTFNDQRPIKCLTPEKIREVDEDIYPGGDIFTTDDGEFIDLEFQTTDFDENELVKYVEFAEALYKKHHKPISIYIICIYTWNCRINFSKNTIYLVFIFII